MGTHIGRSVPRLEDEDFLRGRARYTDDIKCEDQAIAVLVRSPYAHAELLSCDTAAAGTAPGVLGVFTSADLRTAGIREIPSFTRTPPYQMFNADGSEMADASQYPLATDRVRYVGEPVALVVAETAAAARDAAGLVDARYRVLPAVASADRARAEAAPAIWPGHSSNRSCFWETGDEDKTEAEFRAAVRVVEVDIAYPRSIVAFMEPRSAVARFDKASDRYILEAGCQSAHWIQDGLAHVLNVAPDGIRVIVPDTGGGFGARAIVYPEFVCALFAARQLGRPVKWTAERSESFVSDGQARSQQINAQMALDAEGNFLAVRFHVTWEHGGYLAPRSAFVVLSAMPSMICGPYRMRAQHFSFEGVFTTTTPLVSYRGVGRTEAGYVLERLIDAAARETGIDPTELRRRNIIPPETMPYASVAGLTYEKAFFESHLDAALKALDVAGFEKRRKTAEKRGKWHGLAASPYVMTSGGVPEEFARVELAADGSAAVYVGTQDFGMGHKTVFAQIVADQVGLEPGNVEVVFGDTDKVAQGQGGHGSRCMRIGGNTIVQACDAVIAKAADIAAEELEVLCDDLAFEAGAFIVKGTDLKITLAEIARRANGKGHRLAASEIYSVDGPGFPSGAHAVEVEVDPETGLVSLINVATVIDPGRVINPMLVEGQMHGGLVQGIGEAMTERVVYDEATAQLLSGSYMDFTLPRADDIPAIATRLEPLASSANPLGVKGAGEMGCMVIQAVVVNAVLDAVSHAGVTKLDMPLTPQRVWQAIRGNGA